MYEPRGEHRGHKTESGGEGSRREDVRNHHGIRGENGRAVESEPPEPEQEYAQSREAEIATGDSVSLAVDELADSRADYSRAYESRPAADGVYERRACEVVEAQILEPAAAPAPRADDSIADGAIENREDDVRAKLDTFRNRARYDSYRSRRKHTLEYEIRPVAVKTSVVVDCASRALGRGETEAAESEEVPEEPVCIAGVHNIEADNQIGNQADCHRDYVFGQNVDAVLGSAKTGFNQGESGVHRENENRSQENPQIVDRKHFGTYLCRFCSCFLGGGWESRESGQGGRC